MIDAGESKVYMSTKDTIIRSFMTSAISMIRYKDFTITYYIIWNEIPTVLGNLIGGLAFIRLTLYATHVKIDTRKKVELIITFL